MLAEPVRQLAFQQSLYHFSRNLKDQEFHTLDPLVFQFRSHCNLLFNEVEYLAPCLWTSPSVHSRM